MKAIPTERSVRASMLAASPWSEGIPAEIVPRIAACMEVRQVAAGERFVAEAEADPWMGVVISGELEVLQSEVASLERVVRILGPGRMFGEMAMVDGSPRSASIDVVADVTFLCLTPPALNEMVEADPRAAFELMRRVARGLGQTLRNVERNRF